MSNIQPDRTELISYPGLSLKSMSKADMFPNKKRLRKCLYFYRIRNHDSCREQWCRAV